MTRARTWLWTLVAVAAVSALACGASAPAGSGAAGAGGQAGFAPAGAGGDTCAVDEIDGGGADASESEAGTCTPVVEQHADEGATHVPCKPVPRYGTNPPSSGNHYDIWADFKTYTTPVPWGHLVHSLEHGAIVIVYNCPCGCPDEVAAAQAMIDALPVDVGCTAPTKRRVILAPDPKLDVRWAASAWTWTIRSSCFDAAAFSAFASAHYGQTFEDFCTERHEPLCDVP